MDCENSTTRECFAMESAAVREIELIAATVDSTLSMRLLVADRLRET